MRTFRDMPIKQKLMVIIMSVTAAALVLAGLGMVLSDIILFRASMQCDLSALAQILADNSTAALAFDDPRAATETLASLKARPHLAAACIYLPNGAMFASYQRPEETTGCPAVARDQLQFTSTGLVIHRPIELNGKRLGTLVMSYDLGEISEHIRVYAQAVIFVLLISSLVAFLLSSRLRAIIAGPISELAQATHAVSETRDYSIRAHKVSDDELGRLADGFTRVSSHRTMSLGTRFWPSRPLCNRPRKFVTPSERRWTASETR
jgi:methyl-accepting chemotaxis protein